MVALTCKAQAHIAVGVEDARHVLQLVVGARLVLAPGGQPRVSTKPVRVLQDCLTIVVRAATWQH